jgi:hypothetical protein
MSGSSAGSKATWREVVDRIRGPVGEGKSNTEIADDLNWRQLCIVQAQTWIRILVYEVYVNKELIGGDSNRIAAGMKLVSRRKRSVS